MTEKKFDENYWKDKLSSEQFYITRKGGTERPFSGKYLDNKENGIYVCVCCETELFDSDKKYNSNSGWPSFTEPLSDHLIKSLEDRSHFMVRTEVRCNNCDAVHRIIDLCKSEIVIKIEETDSIIDLDEIKIGIPEKVVKILEKNNCDLAT